MAVERDIDALFKMCKDLQAEVENLNLNVIWGLKEEIEDLKAIVTSLLNTSTSRHIAVKEVVNNINSLSVEVNKSLDENDEKVVQLSAEIEEIRDHVK